ncbi:MAG: methylenetetrahydrofolate reductase [Aestuariivita sp.]|nr:methylenetetrahydrofolate reductase [Aestuariivita sp.]MCY4348214.1 methylenetetrahydrofolate reductase [Aestuariivita sp.]
MVLLNFRKPVRPERYQHPLDTLLENYSIEVMPRTADKIRDFRNVLPRGTRVYIAHIEGTTIEDMVATAGRIAAQGLTVMPHFPARIIPTVKVLEEWIDRYQSAANITEALLIAGGVSKPRGDFEDSMQLMQSGLFQRAGFRRLHVAGHPEGNRDIDLKGSYRATNSALKFKQDFAKINNISMAIVTQFAFDAQPIIDWSTFLQSEGISLPIHVGVAGPAKLQTLIKFAIACGVGNSLNVLQKRARDVSKLLTPLQPTDLLNDLARYRSQHPASKIENIHFFPLGGIAAASEWVASHAGAAAHPVCAV